MRRSIFLLIAIGSASLGGCSGDKDTPTPQSSPTTVATAASPSPAASLWLTPTADELAWMRQICDLDGKVLRAEPPATDLTQLTVEQRRSRAETLWPAQAALAEDYVESANKITPPTRAQALHAAFIGIHQSTARELRRSIAESDQIFASVEAIEANNARLTAAENEALAAINAEFNTNVTIFTIRELFLSLPECADSRVP